MARTDQVIEMAGKDVEAAIAAGLARLGVDREAVEVEVLDEGRQGVFGLGARAARVRLMVTAPPKAEVPVEPSPPPKEEEVVSSPPPPPSPPAPPSLEKEEIEEAEEGEVEKKVEKETKETEEIPEKVTEEEPTFSLEEETGAEEAEIVQGVVEDMLSLMDIDRARVEVERAEPGPNEEKMPPWVISVYGPGTDALIGRNAETLDAIQTIARLIVGREMRSWVHLVVDVQDYKAKRAEKLRHRAHRLADQAVDTDRTVVLEPMPPNERRVIHVTLYEDPRVITESIGEGSRRRVTIIPQAR